MKTLIEQLSQYAAYHRDRRNLATHLVGIPLIVVAVTTLLARPSFAVGDVAVSPALLVGAATIGFYLRLDLRFGGAMLILIGAAIAAGQALAALSTAGWLASGIGLFVVGWAIQFVGHHYEGRKPAFVDDVVGLLIGPLFIVAEVAFMAGLRPEVRDAVEQRAGPMRAGAGGSSLGRG